MKKLNHIEVHYTTEGPAHDPWQVETVSFTDINNNTATIQMGSLSGDKLFSEDDPLTPFAEGEQAFRIWEFMTGLTVDRALKIFHERYIEDPIGSPHSYR